jgi:hypothetical protein
VRACERIHTGREAEWTPGESYRLVGGLGPPEGRAGPHRPKAVRRTEGPPRRGELPPEGRDGPRPEGPPRRGELDERQVALPPQGE